MSCGTCQRMRAHLPAAIRQRLEEVERRIEAKRTKRISVSYTTKGATTSFESSKPSNDARPMELSSSAPHSADPAEGLTPDSIEPGDASRGAA